MSDNTLTAHQDGSATLSRGCSAKKLCQFS